MRQWSTLILSAVPVRRARPGLLLLSVVVGGCSVGGLDRGETIAKSPEGIRLEVETTLGSFYGELLEVREEGFLVLVDVDDSPHPMPAAIVLVPPGSVVLDVHAGTGRPWGRERGRRVSIDSPEDRVWLRGMSRFPYGLAPDVEDRLLQLHGQDEIPVLGRTDGGSDAEPSPAQVRAFLEEVRRASRIYRDRTQAVLRGYRRVGPDFPDMGEHWVNTGVLLEGRIEASSPTVLTYADVGGQARLTGAAFALALDAGQEPPVAPVGRTAWHDHDGSVDEEALILNSPHSMHAGGGGPRVSMFHVWLWPPNPDGVLAQNNWALPWARLGLEPPARPDPQATRALSLTGSGLRYYRALFLRMAGLESPRERASPDAKAIERALGATQMRVSQVVAEADSPVLSAEETTELRRAWTDLWDMIRRGVSVVAWDRIALAGHEWGATPRP